jgi:hypothetical protein
MCHKSKAATCHLQGCHMSNPGTAKCQLCQAAMCHTACHTAKNRKCLHVDEIRLIGLIFCKESEYVFRFDMQALLKIDMSHACRLEKAHWNRELARTLNM